MKSGSNRFGRFEPVHPNRGSNRALLGLLGVACSASIFNYAPFRKNPLVLGLLRVGLICAGYLFYRLRNEGALYKSIRRKFARLSTDLHFLFPLICHRNGGVLYIYSTEKENYEYSKTIHLTSSRMQNDLLSNAFIAYILKERAFS